MSGSDNQLQVRSAFWEVLALVLIASALVWPTMLQLFERWEPTPENVLGHGWLVVAVALWGLLRDSRALPITAPWRLRWLPVLLTALASVVWAIAMQAAVGGAQQLLWPLLIAGALWIALGSEALRILFRPLLLLWFASPLWTLLLGVLWFTSTNAVRIILKAIGIPVHFDGNIISLPAGQIEIAAGCAGLAFFTAAVAFGAIIGYLNRASWRDQLVLIAAAGAMAMVCNWIRICWIVYQGYRTNMQTPLITVSHYGFGWTLFAVGLLGYSFLFGRYGQRATPGAPTPSQPEVVQGAPLLSASLTAAIGPAAVLVAALLVAPSATERHLAVSDAQWHEVASPEREAWHPVFSGADVSVQYVSGDTATVTYLYANLYRQQTATRKVISSINSLVPNGRWHVVESSADGSDAWQIVEDSLSRRWLLRYRYVLGTSQFAQPVLSQLSYAMQKFWSRPAAGIVIVAQACGTDCSAARSKVDATWRAHADALVRQIQDAGR